jgi:hypothetical protein
MKIKGKWIWGASIFGIAIGNGFLLMHLKTPLILGNIESALLGLSLALIYVLCKKLKENFQLKSMCANSVNQYFELSDKYLEMAAQYAELADKYQVMMELKKPKPLPSLTDI